MFSYVVEITRLDVQTQEHASRHWLAESSACSRLWLVARQHYRHVCALFTSMYEICYQQCLDQCFKLRVYEAYGRTVQKVAWTVSRGTTVREGEGMGVEGGEG